MSTRTTKPKAVKETDPLLQAIVQKLAAKDHGSRLQRATALAATLFPDTKRIVDGAEDLGPNPGEESVGKFGVFGQSEGHLSFFGVCIRHDAGKYLDKDGDRYPFFRHIPTTPAIFQWLKDNNA